MAAARRLEDFAKEETKFERAEKEKAVRRINELEAILAADTNHFVEVPLSPPS